MTKATTYAQIDQDGYVTSISTMDTPPNGVGWVKCPSSLVMSIRKIKCVGDGQFVQTDESWIPSPTVAMKRAMEYPSVGDQLGAIWKAIAPLVSNPEAEAILLKIQQVKADNPKPSN